ncbi:MAG: DUF1674 domain-containing protein [Gammaproteobacteria bacterium]|nr:DUF1674 domain-containing protein [Gammaproteobacteria bacterium]
MSEQKKDDQPSELNPDAGANPENQSKPVEVGGPRGKEPTRYGDWEKNGRCIDF